MNALILILLIFALLLAVSFIVEFQRRVPDIPTRPDWLPEDARLDFVMVDGNRLRRVRAGKGPPILLLHTLRTQHDLFAKVLPDLAKDYEVHTIDFPGHGFSAIPDVDYDPDLFIDAARGYLDLMDRNDVTLLGESIGGAVGLLLAAEHNPHLARVVAVNSYDYDKGRGILRGSRLSWLIFSLSRLPVIGGLVWRFRWPQIFARVIESSVYDPTCLDPDLVAQMHRLGNRPGHCRAFISLIRNFPNWENLRQHYPEISVPVVLVYGEHDWSSRKERVAAHDLIPGAEMVTVAGAGHLMSFEKPEAVIATVHGVDHG
ncbi:alpha/beta fold hydrolase [Qingshengfaniella alkalisoli]|uniref:Alpha/beta hydrolase n=1 Tax=Qingshengfaniella alkalisoli TaxID=2599296 RepID=A0A5B8JBE0_9RHOB|nr:alpha/beta hydrolase [Qingshengfaniella alkalisoli]QDY71597.1 alpha/beta hydrolase [Qingshengfaniella alkalisoli]